MYQSLLVQGAKFLGREIGKEVAVAAGSAIIGKSISGSNNNMGTTETDRNVYSTDFAVGFLEGYKNEQMSKTELTWTLEQVRNLSESEFNEYVRRFMFLEEEVDDSEDEVSDSDGEITPLGNKERPTDYLAEIPIEGPDDVETVYMSIQKQNDAIINGEIEYLSREVSNSAEMYGITPNMTWVFTETEVDDLKRIRYISEYSILIADGSDLCSFFSQVDSFSS